MSSLWFTSDCHFGHDKLAREIRGFISAEAHDEALITIYNSMINPGDTVICLGDFSLKKPYDFGKHLSRLNGDWHLVSGNHDACWSGHRDGYKWEVPYLNAGFKSVQPFMRRKIDGNNIMMSHFPYTGDHTYEQRFTQYRLRNEGLVLLHGHTHEDKVISRAIATLQIHVGLDAWNLKPVSVNEIIQLIRDEGSNLI